MSCKKLRIYFIVYHSLITCPPWSWRDNIPSCLRVVSSPLLASSASSESLCAASVGKSNVILTLFQGSHFTTFISSIFQGVVYGGSLYPLIYNQFLGEHEKTNKFVSNFQLQILKITKTLWIRKMVILYSYCSHVSSNRNVEIVKEIWFGRNTKF